MTFSRNIDDLNFRVKQCKIKELVELGRFMERKGESCEEDNLYDVVSWYASKSEWHYDEVTKELDKIHLVNDGE